MDKIIALALKTPKQKEPETDFTDRLHHKWTPLILIVFTVLVGTKQLTGAPIKCWCPKHFTGSHCKFTNSYCWVKNTYYHSFEQEIPRIDEEHDYIIYYQWIPFILLFQAFLFHVPIVIWHALNQKAGIDADNIMDTSYKLSHSLQSGDQDKILRLVTNQMDHFLVSRKDVPKEGACAKLRYYIELFLCRCCGRRSSGYLVFLQLFCKLLFILNAAVQLVVLGKLLNTNFSDFGASTLHALVSGTYVWNDNAFPRVTFCDFNIRRLGNVQRYTVQCLLPLNLFLEVMYFFLWFWIMFLICASILNILIWIPRVLIGSDRKKFITNRLMANGDGIVLENIGDFVYNYLQQDGVFLIRLITHVCGSLTANEITFSLYELYKERRDKHDALKENEEDSDV